MLKFIVYIIFLIPLCFLKKSFWAVQNILFFLIFLIIIFTSFRIFYSNISYFLGVDVISYGLIILRVWISSLMVISREKVYKITNYLGVFLFLILFLLLALYLTFRTFHFLLFYVFFERRLIPTIFLILGWGYQPERLRAGLYLLFYTLFASLPLLMVIFFIFNNFLTLNFFIIVNYSIFYFFFYLAIVLAFLVKIPIFLVHL